ncbi:AAA family ATPase [Halomonas sp. BM-2019]|uniref:AAA family ATPase n=1 Tax=Halomonas sp. BM-2019 TaxID=2811227 RepID=UPI001B3C3BC8|nr:MAG: AAA family ATPase [Halomonas sp. BM-2019]
MAELHYQDGLMPDYGEAKRFLECLDPTTNEFTFQTFDDDEHRKSSQLVRVLHGTLDKNWDALCRLNSRGAGVFVTFNATDARGRDSSNITHVRGVVSDFDTQEAASIRLAGIYGAMGIEPTMFVESSEDKHHAYWLADGLTLEEFKPLQKAIITLLDSDPKVHDLPRVMRLAGFVHQKGEPFVSRMIHEGARTTADAIRSALAGVPLQAPAATPQAPQASTLGNLSRYAQKALEGACSAILTAPDGTRNDTLNKEAFGLFGLVKGGHLPEHDARLALERAARGAGLADGEVEATLRSAWDSAQARDIPARAAADDFASMSYATSAILPECDPANDALDALDQFKAKHLLAVEPPPQYYVVDGLIPEPVAAAIVAPGSTGKSFWLMQLAACVATGAPFFGHEVAKPGGVLMLGAEDSRDEMSRRLHAIVKEYEWDGQRIDLETLGENYYPISRLGSDNRLTLKSEGNTVFNHEMIRQIVEGAKLIPDLRLIILDPVSRFRSGDENASEDATRFVEALETIRRETGVTVLCAHHSRKGSRGDSADDIRGASAFVDALRFAATLAVPDPDTAKGLGIDEDDRRSHVRFNVVKSNYRTDIDTYWMRRGIGGVLKWMPTPDKMAGKAEQKGEERYAETLPKLRDLVRRKAEEGSPLTRRELRSYAGTSGMFGMGDQSLRGIMQRALDEGEIVLRDGELHLW